MDKLTPLQREALAKFAGYDISRDDTIKGLTYVTVLESIPVRHWNPLKYFYQARRCLNALMLDSVYIIESTGKEVFIKHPNRLYEALGEGATIEEAICDACLKRIGANRG